MLQAYTEALVFTPFTNVESEAVSSRTVACGNGSPASSFTTPVMFSPIAEPTDAKNMVRKRKILHDVFIETTMFCFS